ncbi:MAG: triose-phosphate isomerase family protein [Pseudomonadota bacterium]
MKRYIVANWKCHKTGEEGRHWFDRFATLYRPHPEVQIVIAPSLLSLESLAAHVRHLVLANVALAVQDISPFPRGGYTGAVAADMVAGLAKYAIVGHSERRRYFHETHMDVANKVAEAIDARLIPIVCVDSSYALAQLGALDDTLSEPLLVAYTPVDAMTAKIAETPARVAESVGHIQQMFSSWPIIYGGALLSNNVGKYLQLPQLAGVFVGEASLDPDIFADICNQAFPLS